MALAPADFAAELLKEAQDTHPWLHHRLFRMIGDGQLTRSQLQNVIRSRVASSSTRSGTRPGRSFR